MDRTDWIAFAIAASLVVFSVTIPPTIGLADNGDFAKITGRFGLCPQIEAADAAFHYATIRYVYESECRWDPGFQTTDAWLAWIAVSADHLFSDDRFFDIRLLGVIHCALFLAAFGLALPLFRNLRPWPRRILLGICIFVLCDAMYVEYFNSFFTDTAAFLFLLLAAVFYLRAHYLPAPKIPATFLYLLCCCLFLLSKAQHAPLGAVLAAFSFPRGLLLWPRRPALSRLIAVVVLAASSLFSFLTPPKGYTKPALFTIIFHSLLPSSQNPLGELRELGLDDSYRRYGGMTAYTPGSPMEDWAWGDQFAETTSYGKLALFYLRHPWRAAYVLGLGLDQATYQRPHNLGNFDKSAGYPPDTKSNCFGLWSGVKHWVFEDRGKAYLGYLLVLLLVIRRQSRQSALFAGCLAGVALGVGSLADSAETTRHLLIFNVLIDLSAIGAAAALAGRSSASN